MSEAVPEADRGSRQIVSRKHRPFAVLAALAGLVLLVIGVRFLVTPEAAQRTFGLARELRGFELHHVIGLRDIWLAGLALAFAWQRWWGPLALWLLLGAGVCFADAAIVAASSAKGWAIAFHTGSGVFCLLLGLRCLRIARG